MLLEYLLCSSPSESCRSFVFFKVTVVLVSYQRQNTDAVTVGSSSLFHLLLEVLDVCDKCMGILQRLRVGFFNYRGGEKAERILEGYFLLTLSTWIGCLKPTVDVVILKPTPFCGIN